ncbi:hypothetical protein BKA62DRAFT_51283 [Auriculariales sp. MPI-PUGE-AT-0066]|nr:hypothetical protein BKA62DRAFT_51283 [Auriculariales sp. MPI-PUGE-AT-0066]
MTADVHEQSAMLDRRQTKRRARNLARLPREVIQLVLTALLDAAVHSPAFYSPWDEDPQLAHSNEVFRGLRIGNLAYVMYSVCQSWGRALEDHEVWTRAHQLIDPYDAFGFHYAQWLHLHAHEHTNNRANAPQISPRTDPSAHTFVTLTTQFYCVPCLVNRPLALTQRPQRGYYYPEPHLAHQIVPPANILNHKLRSWLPSTGLGFVLCCKDHIRTEATCAVCLREGSQVNNKSPYEPIVCENEDEHPTLKMNPSASPTLALGWCGSETLGLSGWCAVGAKKDLPDTLRNWNGYAVYPAEGTLRVWNTCASCRTAAIAGVFEACEAGSSTNSAAVKRYVFFFHL